MRIVTAVSVVLATALGAWIYYNTNVLNRYETVADRDALQADYEKRYKTVRALPMPEAVRLDTTVDIFPAERRVESRGVAVIENVLRGTAQRDRSDISRLSHDQQHRHSEQHGNRSRSDARIPSLRLERTVGAGRVDLDLRWDLSWRNPGFTNSKSTTRVVENGTFVENRDIMPTLGYDPGLELTDNNKRRKHGLPPVRAVAEIRQARDPTPPSQFGVRNRTAFHTTVSTSADQIAVAPGYLERDRTDGGRRYFEYAMDAPIWPFVAFQSARYAVANDRWNDVALRDVLPPDARLQRARG